MEEFLENLKLEISHTWSGVWSPSPLFESVENFISEEESLLVIQIHRSGGADTTIHITNMSHQLRFGRTIYVRHLDDKIFRISHPIFDSKVVASTMEIKPGMAIEFIKAALRSINKETEKARESGSNYTTDF